MAVSLWRRSSLPEFGMGRKGGKNEPVRADADLRLRWRKRAGAARVVS